RSVLTDGHHVSVGAMRVWDIQSGKERLAVHIDPRIGGEAVVFSPDSRFVVIGGRIDIRFGLGTFVRCWDLSTGKEQFKHGKATADDPPVAVPKSVPNPYPYPVDYVGFSVNGEVLFAYNATRAD